MDYGVLLISIFEILEFSAIRWCWEVAPTWQYFFHRQIYSLRMFPHTINSRYYLLMGPICCLIAVELRWEPVLSAWQCPPEIKHAHFWFENSTLPGNGRDFATMSMVAVITPRIPLNGYPGGCPGMDVFWWLQKMSPGGPCKVLFVLNLKDCQYRQKLTYYIFLWSSWLSTWLSCHKQEFESLQQCQSYLFYLMGFVFRAHTVDIVQCPRAWTCKKKKKKKKHTRMPFMLCDVPTRGHRFPPRGRYLN